jgi:hypothetical protein
MHPLPQAAEGIARRLSACAGLTVEHFPNLLQRLIALVEEGKS